MQLIHSDNDVVKYFFSIVLWCVHVLFFAFLFTTFIAFIILPVFSLCTMDVSVWNKLDWLIDKMRTQ